MKTHLFLLVLLIFNIGQLLSIDSENGPKNKNFLKALKLQAGNIGKMFSNGFLDVSQQMKNRYTHLKSRINHNELPPENMKHVMLIAQNYQRVQVTFEGFQPWYRRSPFKLAAIAGSVGFLTGSFFGWKLKSKLSSNTKDS